MQLYANLQKRLAEKREDGTLKNERVLTSAQSAEISVSGIDGSVLNFCSNDYLGLSNHPFVLRAARQALDAYGYGLSSVRFICGTQSLHKSLEERLTDYLGTQDTLIYTSCFGANGGLFESVLGEQDTIVSAVLNHASIIDGVRLCKAKRLFYNGESPDDLDRVLDSAACDGETLVITDGVFSMEGALAPLDRIVPVCRRHGVLLAVDDSHATGVVGERGRGTPEWFGVDVDVYTGTLGKALGGANGGYISGDRTLIAWLRNTSRPYLFSNSLAPCLVAGAHAAIDIVDSDEGIELRARLRSNAARFRSMMQDTGFDVPEGEHPIVPVMFKDAALAARVADRLLELGVYVISFSYPVVPKESPRIRVQLSAAHSQQQIERAVSAFVTAGREVGLVSRSFSVCSPRTNGKTMRAWVYRAQRQQDGGHLSLETVPVPTPSPGELLLKILRVTVCGTDESLFRGKFTDVDDGIIPGHEVFGEIVDWGGNVRGFEVGQKVVAESHYLLPGYLEEGVIGLWGPKLPKGGYLRPINGGYAEYMTLPSYCAHVIPAVLDKPDFFPSLLEGAGNDCLIGKFLLERDLLGSVAVVGCGPHGLFTQMFCKHFGVRQLVALEVDDARLRMAKDFGADVLINPTRCEPRQQASQITNGIGFDVVIDIAGGKREVLNLCMDLVKDGGNLILFGLYGDPSIALDGHAVDDIIFAKREIEIVHAAKRIRVNGITGREGIWEYLVDAVAVSSELRTKLMKPVTIMGTLENLGSDTSAMDCHRIMKRAYYAFPS